MSGIKAKNFWNLVCLQHNIRLFCGVPSSGFSPLYKSMDSKFLHYIPTMSENIAVGIINGAYFTGMKGAILLSNNNIYKIFDSIYLNIKNKVPLIIFSDTIVDTLIHLSEVTYINIDKDNFEISLNEGIIKTYTDNNVSIFNMNGKDLFI